MNWERRIVMGLLTSVAASGAQAQEYRPLHHAAQLEPKGTQSETPPTDAASNSAKSGPEPASDKPVFLNADGVPFPPEIQRQLQEQLDKAQPPTVPQVVVSPRSSRGAADGEITVTGQRPRGSVMGDIPPQQTFSPLDIRAYGANNIGELLQNIQSQVSSDRGREDSGPITLLNGRRISDFVEVSRIPTEAIERMEVFPEELALKYGYRADQKVVNIVTFERFASTTGLVSYVLPTEGARNTGAVTADYFAIRDDTRYGFGGEYRRSELLLESDRNVRQFPSTQDFARFRTLLPENDRLALNGLVSGRLLGEVSSTLNGRYERNESRSLLGLGQDGPLKRDLNTQTLHLGTTLNGRAGRWLWSLTGTYDRASTHILTDIDRAARDRARSVNSFADADLVFSGPMLELPAGPVSTTLRGGFSSRGFLSQSSRGGAAQDTELSRDRGTVQASIDLPLASQRTESPVPLGNLSANAHAQIEQLSDIGTLRTFGYGLNWSPIGAINVIASVTDEQGAPTVEQLGGPIVVTPNVRTYDFTRSEVVDVTRVFGGNPNLRFDNRQVLRLGLNAKPFPNTDFTLNADYLTTRIDRPIVFFPIATSAVEAAFPERFARNAEGRLLRIDNSPLNFQRSEQEQLRWGVNFTRPLGPVPTGSKGGGGRFFSSEAEMRRMQPPGGRIIMAEPGSPLAKRLENMTSRLFFSLYHTWYFKDEILLLEGVPELDLLNGDAVDFRGGRRRHEIEFQAGVFKRGLGARVTANWQSATRARGAGGTAGDLRFSDFGTVNINLFANLADYFGPNSPSWLKGTRLTLGVSNLFNNRPQVRDETGSTPLSYQPAYLDPIGRFANLSLRKVF